MKCFDENTQVYLWLLAVAKASGISEFQLRASVGQYYDRYNEWPPLDYIPGIDSESYLRELLKVKDTSGLSVISLSNLKKFTGKTDVKEALLFLNNTYVDLEVTITPMPENKCVIKFHKRPNIFSNPFTENINWNAELINRGAMTTEGLTLQASTGILNNIIERITDRYGVKMQRVSSADIDADPRLSLIPNAKTSNSFIYDGTIYINTDYARADAPLHELMHLIIGQLRTSNPTLYGTLLSSIEGDPDTDTRKAYKKALTELTSSDVYGKRTRNDINEEILVSEFARFIMDPTYSGLFNTTDKDKIINNISKAIDTILLPVLSSKSIRFDRLMTDSIVGLSLKLGSALIIPTYMGSLNSDDVIISRRLANYKLLLMSDGKLEEHCDV